MKLCMRLWRDNDIASTHLLGPEIYLPDADIKLVLDHFYELTSVLKRLGELVTDLERQEHIPELFGILVALQEHFATMERAKKDENNCKQLGLPKFGSVRFSPLFREPRTRTDIQQFELNQNQNRTYRTGSNKFSSV
jgi:hypothetical protein